MKYFPEDKKADKGKGKVTENADAEEIEIENVEDDDDADKAEDQHRDSKAKERSLRYVQKGVSKELWEKRLKNLKKEFDEALAILKQSERCESDPLRTLEFGEVWNCASAYADTTITRNFHGETLIRYHPTEWSRGGSSRVRTLKLLAGMAIQTHSMVRFYREHLLQDLDSGAATLRLRMASATTPFILLQHTGLVQTVLCQGIAKKPPPPSFAWPDCLEPDPDALNNVYNIHTELHLMKTFDLRKKQTGELWSVVKAMSECKLGWTEELDTKDSKPKITIQEDVMTAMLDFIKVSTSYYLLILHPTNATTGCASERLSPAQPRQ